MRSNTLGKFTFKSVLARPFGVSGSKCHSARGGVHRRGPGAASAASAITRVSTASTRQSSTKKPAESSKT